MKGRVKTLLMLIANTVIMLALYLLFVNINATVTLIVFTVIAAGFSFGYVIYNRGFSRLNVTAEMLPPEWSYEKKCEFIEDGKRRIEKSKWMLTIILPIIVVYAFELFSIYLMPMIENILKI